MCVWYVVVIQTVLVFLRWHCWCLIVIYIYLIFGDLLQTIELRTWTTVSPNCWSMRLWPGVFGGRKVWAWPDGHLQCGDCCAHQSPQQSHRWTRQWRSQCWVVLREGKVEHALMQTLQSGNLLRDNSDGSNPPPPRWWCTVRSQG